MFQIIPNYCIAEDVVAINSHDEAYAVVRDGENPYFDQTINYIELPVYDDYHSELWSSFCETVKHQSRFFNSSARDLLNEILEDVGELRTVDNIHPIREFGGPESEEVIFRGRRAESRSAVNDICVSPAAELGPPPKEKTPAGRMNPAGIPFLYGSLDRATCIAELRAPVGGTIVTGMFEVLQPLRVLDITALRGAFRFLSMFADDFESRTSHLKFLRRLDSEVAKPILPGDELLEYIPTQAFVEYLAAVSDPPFDALIFSSAQTGEGGKNIVIFPHATRLQTPDNLPEEVIYAESVFEDEYVLYEGDEADIANGGHLDYRKYTLNLSEAYSDDPIIRFVEESVEVHSVRVIEHHVDTQNVRIHEKSNDDDF